jgi:hypothetical protein
VDEEVIRKRRHKALSRSPCRKVSHWYTHQVCRSIVLYNIMLVAQLIDI